MPIQSKLHPARFVLAGLLAAISISFIHVRAVRSQPRPLPQTLSKVKLAPEAEITVIRLQAGVESNMPNFRTGVSCPPNTMAIGGGGEVSPSGVNAYIKASYPFLRASAPYPQAWVIDGFNSVGQSVTFNIYVVCAQLKQ